MWLQLFNLLFIVNVHHLSIVELQLNLNIRYVFPKTDKMRFSDTLIIFEAKEQDEIVWQTTKRFLFLIADWKGIG